VRLSVDLRIFTEPQQGATYDDLARVAIAAEENGFDAFFRSDHYLAMGREGRPGPTDAWVTLAGLARDTSRLRLGTMVTAVTFRLPGPLAIAVATVDQMSNGRVEFGIGAAWNDAEHRAYGIPFPSVRARFDRLEETLAIVTGLWSTPEGQRFSYGGTQFTLADSPALPKPVQTPHPPVIVGGMGRTRTPGLAARYADEFNVPFASVEETARQIDRVGAACREMGRSDSMVFSAAQTTAVGADEAEFARRAAAVGQSPESLRTSGLGGTVNEVVDRIGAFAELGVTRMYLQIMDLADLDHLAFIAAEVAPKVR
jgi:F420-dependent oxidoreductase-like protein